MNKVTATVTGGDYDRDQDGWEHHAYKVTLRYQGRTMTTPFKSGMANGEPTAEDVLYCLLSDASSADQDYEDWAGDYGYDDSPSSRSTYKAVQQQTKKLRKLLAGDYDQAVWPQNEDHEQAAERMTS